MIISLIIKIILYLFWLPILMFVSTMLFKMIKMRIQRKMRLNNRNNNAVEKVLFSKKLHKGVKFEMKGDKRPLSKKISINRTMVFWIITVIGLLLAIASEFVNIELFIISLLFSAGARFYAYGISKGLLQQQEDVKQRLYDSKKDVMGLVSNARDGINYDAEFKILEWAPDNIKFNKVMMTIPTSFDQLRTGAVIDKMNQNFGGGTAWVADTESETHGWDFVTGKVTLKRTAELPHMAAWDAHYVLNEDIAWSFFPLGLGVENGVELVNPETGKTEHVLGFDLQGEEQKLGKKKGFAVGPEIIAAPQVLIAGGTGGGKSLSEDTIVPTVVADSEK